ncbi:hypothetical protein ACKI1J_42885 [Streptomyces scabiei]|uniref:hypothetical protein n=1 Tax=Streptomyces TaxID=1883 RepID=UPI0029BCC4C7|nr:hypothetical protein [Streptomyces stelliscabiei]MDX2552574.1 hypothetical protein [Streptomyces stelliscabiei]
MNQDVKLGALADLHEFEAAVFRFGVQVRAFLDAFPAGVPEPSAVLPKFADTFSATGDPVYGGGSYVHVLTVTPGDVAAWAPLLDAPATEKISEITGAVSVIAEGVLDGLNVYVSCMDLARTRELDQARNATETAAAGGAG